MLYTNITFCLGFYPKIICARESNYLHGFARRYAAVNPKIPPFKNMIKVFTLF